MAGLSAVTDFSVIYSTEHMRLSIVRHRIHSRAHNKSLLGFSKEYVHEIACWLRNHFPRLDLPLHIKSQKHICSWTLGISFDPKCFSFSHVPAHSSHRLINPRAFFFTTSRSLLYSSGNLQFASKNPLFDTLRNRDYRFLAFPSYFPAEKQHSFSG